VRYILFALAASVAACAFLSASDKALIAKDAATIAQCQSLGHACKADGGKGCFGVYDACMRDGGLR